MIVLIDDLRSFKRRHKEFAILRSSDEAVRWLQRSPRDVTISELWLDHDLGGEDTIMPVVDVLSAAAFEGAPFNISQIFVHSANPVGAQNVMRALSRWYPRVSRVSPFSGVFDVS